MSTFRGDIKPLTYQRVMSVWDALDAYG